MWDLQLIWKLRLADDCKHDIRNIQTDIGGWALAYWYQLLGRLFSSAKILDQDATKVVVLLSRTWARSFGQVNHHIYSSKGLMASRFFCETRYFRTFSMHLDKWILKWAVQRTNGFQDFCHVQLMAYYNRNENRKIYTSCWKLKYRDN